MMLAVTLAAAAVVGLTLGLLGGGGSILTVPVLLYLAHVPARSAISMSLFVVAATAAAGLVGHARAGRVRWRTGAVFAVAGMAGAYAGGRLAAYLPDAVLLTGFALMMAATAVGMLRRRRGAAPATADPGGGEGDGRRQRLPLVLAEGTAVGAVTGLVGAGGGFIVVPALVLLGGLPMSAAVGTSLLVIAAQSAAGFVGHLHGARIDWPLTLAITAVAVAAALVGARWSGRIDAAVLRRVFGAFVAVMAAVVLAGQVPPAWRRVLLHQPTVAVVLGAIMVVVTLAAARRQRNTRRGAATMITPGSLPQPVPRQP